MALHRPPYGETMMEHQTSADCPCKPVKQETRKQRTTGRFGKHQGYKTGAVVFQHNPMPKELEVPDPPESPVWFTQEADSGWQSGWTSGYAAGYEARKNEED